MAKKVAKKETPKAPAKAAPKAKEVAKKAPAKAAPKAAKEKEVTPEAAPEVLDAAPAKKADGKKAPKGKAKKADKVVTPVTDNRWIELREKHAKDKAPKYSMTGQYQANQPIEHTKLGWGFVLTNVNDRLEVIFQDGVKILISNYNQSQKI